MADRESQNPVVIPADPPPRTRPTVVPYGGIGGLLFWVSVSVFLGIGTFHFYRLFTVRDREARALQGDSELLRRENQKMRAVVDQLQTELSQTGTLLRLQQDLLSQAPAANGAGQKVEEKGEALTPSQTLELRALEERLDKALAARISAKEASILPQERGVVIALDSRVLFPGAGPKIGAPGEALLHEVAAGLQPILGSAEVRIVAFADSAPAVPGARKNAAGNWEACSLRSAAVAKALVEVEHLPAGQVVASCRGAVPVAESGSADNQGYSGRRLEIGIFLEKTPVTAEASPDRGPVSGRQGER